MHAKDQDNGEKCELFCSDSAKVERVRESLKETSIAVEIFKALSDETRFKLIFALWREELCVCDLALIVDMPVAAVSYHLRYLRSLRLVRYEKRGKMVFYNLNDCHIDQLIGIAIEHANE